MSAAREEGLRFVEPNIATDTSPVANGSIRIIFCKHCNKERPKQYNEFGTGERRLCKWTCLVCGKSVNASRGWAPI